MEIQFKGKRALVTGAGKGIGRETAKKLVELGAETVAVSRTQSDLDSLKIEVPSVITVQLDLRDWNATREAMQGVGPIDLLVNNAGVIKLDHFLDVKKKDIDWMMDVNYKAVFNVSQVIAKSMVERKCGGAIVNISSVSSLMAFGGHAAYCSSKGAVDSLTQVMALELGPHNIRVNAVNPTVALTKLGREAWSDPAKAGPLLARIPMGRFLEVSDVVDCVMFLLSDKAKMIHGIAMPLEGGLGAN